MLVNLDNEVHFKKVFTDIEVFSAFVKDVIGIELNIDKVETEKVLDNPVGAIKFRMDLYAEDADNRTVVEIQKIDYDYNFNRFTHYFIGNIIDTQRTSKDYAFDKEVYVIVVLTTAYRISDVNGKAIKDDVLVTDLNPRTLKEEVRTMLNHKLMILNTTNVTSATPPEIADWLNLITESMHHPENPNINTNKPGIARAAKLAALNNIDGEQLAEAKIQEMRKVMIAMREGDAKQEGRELEKDVRIEKALKKGKFSKEDIADLFEVTIEYVEQIDKLIKPS